MATFDDIRRKIDAMADNVKRHAPGIIAETATEYYKERFRKKDWEGAAWTAAKHQNPRGSLMVRSGSLLSTVRPTLVTDREVRIGAGSAKVPYARIHNEGGTIKQTSTAKQKRFFWAMEHKSNPVVAGEEHKAGGWAKMATKNQLVIDIPKRQFMGHSPELNKKINARLEALAKEPLK